jgi:hypothetical protein
LRRAGVSRGTGIIVARITADACLHTRIRALAGRRICQANPPANPLTKNRVGRQDGRDLNCRNTAMLVVYRRAAFASDAAGDPGDPKESEEGERGQ